MKCNGKVESSEDIKKQKGRGNFGGSVTVNDKLMWLLIWLSRNAATINVTLQLIYIYIYKEILLFVLIDAT